MRGTLAEAQLALMLLSRLPAGKITGDAPATGQAAWAFPLVGVLIGGLSGAVFWLASANGLPALAAALLAIGTAVLATGALHEDGLADVADGFGGGRDRTAKLEIMRDSRLGSYGAVALFLTLGLTASGIAEAGGFAAFAAIGALSRTAMLMPMALLPPARADGLGAAAAGTTTGQLVVSAGLTVVIALPVLGPWPIFAAIVVALALAGVARHQIGGQTGDVLGATQKLAECTAWLGLAATAF